MDSRTLQLDVSEALYREWAQQPDPVRAAALERAAQAVRDYLRMEAGRELLLHLPEDAYEICDTAPAGLAEGHDRYLYEDDDAAS